MIAGARQRPVEAQWRLRRRTRAGRHAAVEEDERRPGCLADQAHGQSMLPRRDRQFVEELRLVLPVQPHQFLGGEAASQRLLAINQHFQPVSTVSRLPGHEIAESRAEIAADELHDGRLTVTLAVERLLRLSRS